MTRFVKGSHEFIASVFNSLATALGAPSGMEAIVVKVSRAHLHVEFIIC